MSNYIVRSPGHANSGGNATLALLDGLVLELEDADVEAIAKIAEVLPVSASVYDQLRERLLLPPVPSEVLDDDLPPRMTAPPS